MRILYTFEATKIHFKSKFLPLCASKRILTLYFVIYSDTNTVFRCYLHLRSQNKNGFLLKCHTHYTSSIAQMNILTSKGYRKRKLELIGIVALLP